MAATSGRARRLPHPGLHARGRRLAGRARGELPARRARGRLVRPSPSAPRREPAHQAAADATSSRSSRPSGEPGGAPPRRHHLPVEQQLLHRARRLGARSRSATSPTPRTRRSAPTCSPPAGPRSTTPPPGWCTRTTTGWSTGSGATSTSTAASATAWARSRTASPGRAFGIVRRSVAADRAYLAPRGALAPWRGRAGPPRARCTTAGGVVFGGLGERADLRPRPGALAALARPPRRRRDAPGGALGSPRLRGRAARVRRRGRAARRAVAVRRRARVARAGLGRAALRGRQRRPDDDLPGHARARAARPPLLALAARPGGHRAALERGAAPPDRASTSSRFDGAGGDRLRALDGLRRGRSPPAGRRPTRCCGLPGCRGRAYFVQDHEPDFYATSAQHGAGGAHLRASGMPCIAASPWLAALLGDRYGAEASAVRAAAWTRAEYHPMPDVPRRGDTVVFYARDFTPRRGVELGLMALQLLRRARPGPADRAVRDPQPRPRAVRVRAARGGVHRAAAAALLARPRSGSACRSPTTR